MSLGPTTLQIVRLPHAADLPPTSYAKPGDSGLDLRAAIRRGDRFTHYSRGGKNSPTCFKPEGDCPDYTWVNPGDRVVIPTGLRFSIPAGFEGQVRPRSGISARHGLVAVLGTIDRGYVGEVSVILINHGHEQARIARGDRIAQLVIAPVAQVQVLEVEELDETERGAGGFGSTGVS